MDTPKRLLVDLSNLENFIGKEFFLLLKIRTDTMLHDGHLLELVSREPGIMQGYPWPHVNTITYPSGVHVGSTLRYDKPFKPYLVTIDSVNLVDDKPFRRFILSGYVKEFSLRDNLLGAALDEKIIMAYQPAPYEKGILTKVGSN